MAPARDFAKCATSLHWRTGRARWGTSYPVAPASQPGFMDASRNRFPSPRQDVDVADPEAIEATRRLHCRFYDHCLDVADAAGWAGFSCAGCVAYDPLTAMGEKRDLRGMLELLVELRLGDVVPDHGEE